MKRAFITGAAGFIGGYVVREFVDQGWEVIALVHRRTSGTLMDLSGTGRLTVVKGDVTSFQSLRDAVLEGGKGQPINAFVHCAGRASDVGRRRHFRKTNYESVQHAVRLVEDLGIDRLVFVSTVDVYGLRDFNGESEEELDFGERPENPYPEFKIKAEKWISGRLPSARYSIVRPAEVWGVGDETLTPRIVEFLRTSPWIVHFGKWRGSNRWPLAHVRNVASGIFLAATLPAAAGKAINVVDDERTSMDEFCRILGNIYLPGKTLKSVSLPLFTGKIPGATITCISNLLDLDKPFADPTLYALRSVSSDLDFGNQRLHELLSTSGRRMLTRDEGVAELREFVRGTQLIS